jgi:hypothetical protein
MCFINSRVQHLMMGTSCVFILTKSLNLPLYYFFIFLFYFIFFIFFFHMYNYVFIDSLVEDEYRKASDSLGGFDSGDA